MAHIGADEAPRKGADPAAGAEPVAASTLLDGHFPRRRDTIGPRGHPGGIALVDARPGHFADPVTDDTVTDDTALDVVRDPFRKVSHAGAHHSSTSRGTAIAVRTEGTRKSQDALGV
ncbi:hypothetical protein AB0H12_21095 [Actinosynnema sp. NPDC023794]